MTTVQERPVATTQTTDDRARRLPDADPALPARAAGALLPDVRLGARGRGPGPGDVPAGLEGRRRTSRAARSVRTWLYRIATNVCLTNLEGRPAPAAARRARHRRRDGRRRARARPRDRLARAGARRRGRGRRARLDPARVRRRAPAPAGPPARGADPARRAALVGRRGRRGPRHHRGRGQLRAPARARPARRARPDRGHRRARPRPPASSELLDRYVDAFWRKDIDAIVGLLTAEATWDMPPFTSWYRGDENIGWLIGTECPGGANDMPMIATRANGQPAFGLYMRTPQGDFEPFQLQVLELDGDQVAPRHRVLRAARCSRRSGCRRGCPPTTARRPVPPSEVAAATTSAGHESRGPAVTAAALDGSVELLDRSLAYTRVALADVRPDLLDRPTPCAGWTLGRPARPHGGRARRVHRGRRRPGRGRTRCPPTRRAGSRRCEEKACALLGAWTAGAAAPGRRRGRRPRPRQPRCWSPPPPSRSPCTAGTSARPPVAAPRSPTTWPAACCRRPTVDRPGRPGPRFATARPARARDAPYDVRLLAWPDCGRARLDSPVGRGLIQRSAIRLIAIQGALAP